GGTTGRQLRAHHRLAHEGCLECTALAREDDTWRARCGHRDLVAVDRVLAPYLRHRQRRDVDHARTPEVELVQTLIASVLARQALGKRGGSPGDGDERQHHGSLHRALARLGVGATGATRRGSLRTTVPAILSCQAWEFLSKMAQK